MGISIYNELAIIGLMESRDIIYESNSLLLWVFCGKCGWDIWGTLNNNEGEIFTIISLS